MVFSPAQQRALNDALPQAKAAMRALFNRQNSQNNNGQKGRGNRRQNNNLGRMQPSYNHAKGSMPDLSKGNWHQTPASSNTLAPRGFGYYDAFAHDPYSVATHMSVGPATPIVGSTVCQTNLSTKASSTVSGTVLEAGFRMLIVQPACGENQAVMYEVSSTVGTDLITHTPFPCSQLTSDPPTSAIPTRCSLRIRNWTQDIALGGTVRVLRATTGLAINVSATTNEELVDLADKIRNHSRTRTYSGRELSAPMQKNCTVVDQGRATTFVPWGVIASGSQLPWALMEGWGSVPIPPFTSALHDPAFTPIVVLFEPFQARVDGGDIGNSYEVVVRSQFLGHYIQGSMLANMAIAAPSLGDGMNRLRNAEEAKGSTLEKVLMKAMDAAPTVMSIANTLGPMAKRAGMLALTAA
jgi:hypothetical protein